MTNDTITITYGRKVPGAQDYSSESLHVSLTQGLGDEPLQDNELRDVVDTLHRLVKEEVDKRLPAELPPRPQLPMREAPGFRGSPPPFGGSRPRSQAGNGRDDRRASPKQVSYLQGLANQRGLGLDELATFLEQHAGKRDPYALSTAEASSIIDLLKA